MIQAGGREQAPFSMKVALGAGVGKDQAAAAIPAAEATVRATLGISRSAAENRAGRAVRQRLTSLSSNSVDVLAGNSLVVVMARR
jgi:hypothetical protein